MGSISWHKCLQISRLSAFFLQCVLAVADHQFDSSPKLDFLVSARRHAVQDGQRHSSPAAPLICSVSTSLSFIVNNVSARPVTLTVLCRNTCSACESVGRCFIQTLPFCWISYYTQAQHRGRELLTTQRPAGGITVTVAQTKWPWRLNHDLRESTVSLLPSLKMILFP